MRASQLRRARAAVRDGARLGERRTAVAAAPAADAASRSSCWRRARSAGRRRWRRRRRRRWRRRPATAYDVLETSRLETSTASNADPGTDFRRLRSELFQLGSGTPLMNQRRAVVREHHPVLLERAEDDLVLRREAADVVARLQPEPRAHGRVGGAAGRGLVARRPDVRVGGSRRREADDMVDLARGDLVVADEAREDRKAGRVARRPAERAHRVRAEIPGRARAGGPRRAAALRVRAVQLPEPARVTVDEQHMAVAGRARTAFDRGVRRDRIRARHRSRPRR